MTVDLTARITEILHAPFYGSDGISLHLSFNGRRLSDTEVGGELSHLIAQAAEEHYRPRIETPQQLDALPVGSVVRTTEGRVAEKTGEHWGNASGYGSWWNETGDEISCGSDELDDLPAIVLWSPGAGE